MEKLDNQEIRALSWKQPFASLMLHGKVETRSWATDYRGLVLICVSKQPFGLRAVRSICGDKIFFLLQQFMGRMGIDTTPTLGKAIAVGRLVDCRFMHPEDAEKCWVAYSSDLYCHVYEDVRPIKQFAWKGSQGWRKLDQTTIDKIEYLK